ncbi:hypothetical protein L6164_022226 [Bauhinia variegata]|uniref:Uncharacterized protein n=1 Tax=Bauhinia variegata TaxID=167791 RepID=A0ACB9MEC0_BAUVA|nr:hypothetical protein L6164_022226 [Bauhinia variegata]
MDRSLNSSMGKAVASAEENLTCAEESGWTAYFEDFSNNMEHGSACFSLADSSLVSDAASCAAWKFSHNSQAVSRSSLGVSGLPNPSSKLSFKKTRTEQILKDDPLEDTASSPVNSPKVGELNPNDQMISRKIIDDQLDGAMGKRFTSEDYSELPTDDKHEIGYKGKNIECTDLKKRGLCLVPLSKFVNYFG